MRLKNENFPNMVLNLRSGMQVRTDHEGSVEVENEADAQFMISHGGWKPTAARSPRALPGMSTTGAPGGPLWPGGPTRRDVEDMRTFANEAHDALHDAKNDLMVKDGKIAALEAEVADLKARLASQAPASGPEGGETGESTSEASEGDTEASEGRSAKRKPKAPKPE